MGLEWLDGPRSPMDTGGSSGESGGGNNKLAMFSILAFLALPAGVVGGVLAFILHGNGVI